MKRLWENCAEPFRVLESSPAGDGFGGCEARFSEGAVFLGAAVPLRRGEAGGGPVRLPGGGYRLTAEADAPIRYGAYVRRESDGAVFRISGEVSRTPEGASFALAAAEAERIGGPPPVESGEEAGA
ncbi:MAG: hypothetical protein E7576_10830 [Ruminococcaceae bacterium]|nr:hypothetical protein [Oscillospiraceae bacterium]